MTDEQWRAGTDPNAMLEWLRTSGRATDRKLRLFAVACCRQVRHLLADERVLRAVEVAERYADGSASEQERAAAQERAFAALRSEENAGWAAVMAVEAGGILPIRAAGGAAHMAAAALCTESNARFYAWVNAYAAWDIALAEAAGDASQRANWDGLMGDVSQSWCEDEAVLRACREQAAWLRDIFGDPCLGAIIDPDWLAWNEGTLPGLAGSIYEERAFDRMPILGDALEDAGCNDEFILTHCRSQAGHVRGCWVLDAVLGKE
jgi:hypothetical protein